MGMAGTGSHDIRFDHVFVPDHRVYGDGRPPSGGTVEAPVYRTQQHGGPFALAAAALGIAVGFVEQYTRVTAGRVTRGVKIADQQSMQMRIGESALQIEAALALFRAAQKELMALFEGTPRPSELRTALSAAPHAVVEQAVGAYVAHSAYEAVERLFRVIGANQLKLTEPLQRAFRDIASAIQQPFNNCDSGRTVAGRALLGAG
jgi:alkylation response protein AidB-like acyl-CoA dehydrogenase